MRADPRRPAGVHRAGRPQRGEAAAGINALEGYLLWQAEAAEARTRARAFTDLLPWLTRAQRDEVELAYVRDHLGRAKSALQATAHRREQLRAEYRGAYLALRRRLTAAAALGLSAVAALAALLLAARR